ncbi:hypothetical protein PROSTU_00193 [Providencia stuartii ATCC 25827]|uniref:Uncharacterized protein n=1 Tax=Providencia stuartii ATCC 25827 TaxID=471874 RepID=A0AA86YPF7_PROST|nr:hypothetical protein PROSTU_00193 [Providencia stuartii ATCC 25827]
MAKFAPSVIYRNRKPSSASLKKFINYVEFKKQKYETALFNKGALYFSLI